MSTLHLMPTSELESMVSALAIGSPRLNSLEREAVITAIRNELAERDATRRSVFRFASECERLQAVIEEKEGEVFQLQCEISLLEDLEQQRKASGKAKSGGGGLS